MYRMIHLLAIKVFREIGHPGMVMALEEIKVIIINTNLLHTINKEKTFVAISSMSKTRISSLHILQLYSGNTILPKSFFSNVVAQSKH